MLRNKKYSLLLLGRGLSRHIPLNRKLQLFLVILLMILTSLAEVFSIGLLIPFLSIIGNPTQVFDPKYESLLFIFGIESPSTFLSFFTAAFCLSAVAVGFLRYLLMWSQTRLSFSIGIDLSVQIYQNVLYQQYITHVRRNSSEVIAAITSKVTILVNNGIYPALVLLSSAFLILTIFATLVFINTALVLSLFLGLGLLYFALIYLVRKKLSQNSLIINKEQVMVLKALQEGLGGIRDVILDGTQKVYIETYKKSESALRNSLANIQIISSAPRHGIESLGMVVIAIAAYIISSDGSETNNSIALLGAIAFGAQKLLPLLQQFYANLTGVLGSRDSLGDALDLLNLQSLANVKNPTVYSDSDVISGGQIELKNVSFRYAQNEPLILKNINIFIPTGSVIGIIGVTGSGKSTLIDLMLGLLSPESGEVLIDGKNVGLLKEQAHRIKIAHVPQSIFLSDQSVAENIAFGVPRDLIDLQRIRSAAEGAQIASEIESLPNGYNTLVGERGIRFSGGQRQRIGIARAIYKNANIIILDEATSALDSITENEVMSCIEASRNITLVMVSHRMTTLRKCHAVYEVSNGEIKKIEDFDQFLNERSPT